MWKIKQTKPPRLKFYLIVQTNPQWDEMVALHSGM